MDDIIENQEKIDVKKMKNKGEILYEWAYDENNKLVHITDVTRNGLACNCTCPCCHDKMVANQGEIKTWYFSHEQRINCKGYHETLLHIWAKQILQEDKVLAIPYYEEISNLYTTPQFISKNFRTPEEKLIFETVEIEKRNDLINLQPDIIGVTKEGDRIWVEMCVTHKCDLSKIEKIKRNGINCIEITIPKEIVDKETLREFLEENYDKKSKIWINYPRGNKEIVSKKKEVYNDLLNKANQVYIQDCDKCFGEQLQKKYTKLLNDFSERLPSNYNWIFRKKFLKDLAEKSPKFPWHELTLLKQEQKGVEVSENVRYFVHEISELIINYLQFIKLGQLTKNGFDWRCENICAFAEKDENKAYIFCSKEDKRLKNIEPYKLTNKQQIDLKIVSPKFFLNEIIGPEYSNECYRVIAVLENRYTIQNVKTGKIFELNISDAKDWVLKNEKLSTGVPNSEE